MKKIFIICPVRKASPEQQKSILDYVVGLEIDGHEVYYPAQDTDQDDDIGYRICQDNRKAIFEADEVHLYWDANSKGTLFDLGIAFAYDKPLVVINKADVFYTEDKSFENVVLYWSS